MGPRCLALIAAVLASSTTFAADTEITIKADGGHPVPKSLYGIFFEEINRAGDGGIYAEMLLNRSFEDDDKEAAAWKLETKGGATATMRIVPRQPQGPMDDSPELGWNRKMLQVTVSGTGSVSLVNEGFAGLSLRKGERYIASFDAMAIPSHGVSVSLMTKDGHEIANGVFNLAAGQEWNRFESSSLTSPVDATDTRLVLSFSHPGVYSIDNVSLFPTKTWKSRPNGLRPDLMEMIAGMKPGFVRFPGGCWVEGERMADAYRWKDTIGPIFDRRTQVNLWKYKSTNGLGYHEYLQMCEDLGAEPLFVINVGMSHRENVPMEKMGEFVQDALDAIEYANGPADSTWGKKRADAGHPAPFNLKYLEIGNENGGPAYDERYALMYDAVKKKHPEIQTVANLWNGLPKSRPIEMIDEHYYDTPKWFLQNAGKYDSYDRKGPKIYVGEYAVTRGGVGSGNLRAAIAEAAFMIGMERNSDVVVMSSYAPLLTHTAYKVWNPDAIVFDASRVYGTPSYWVQRLFAENLPERTLPVTVTTSEQIATRSGTVGIGTWATQAEFKDIQLTGADGAAIKAGKPPAALKGDWSEAAGTWSQTSNDEGAFQLLNVPASGTYTLSLKARKTAGREGFLIRVHSADADNYTMWNLGGWNNSRSAIEVCEDGGKSIVGNGSDLKVTTGQWYDLRIEATPTGIKCFVDGKLTQEASYGSAHPVYATAGVRGDETIIKLVNGTNEPQPVSVRIEGSSFTGDASATLLTSSDPAEENSLAEPNRVVPKPTSVEVKAGSAATILPPQSVTMVRVKR